VSEHTVLQPCRANCQVVSQFSVSENTVEAVAPAPLALVITSDPNTAGKKARTEPKQKGKLTHLLPEKNSRRVVRGSSQNPPPADNTPGICSKWNVQVGARAVCSVGFCTFRSHPRRAESRLTSRSVHLRSTGPNPHLPAAFNTLATR
jgi:hypothetical protein